MNGKWMVGWTKGWMWSISLLGDANDDVASSLLMLSSCMNKSLWLWPQVFNIRTGNHRNTSYIKEISIHWNYFFYDFPGVGCFVCCLFCLRHYSFYSTVSLSVIISTVVCYSSLSFPIRVFFLFELSLNVELIIWKSEFICYHFGEFHSGKRNEIRDVQFMLGQWQEWRTQLE